MSGARKLCLAVSAGALLLGVAFAQQTSKPQELPMHHAHGTFNVKMGPPTPGPAAGLSHFGMTKDFHGDFEGTGIGEMMSAGDYTKGSAGYVAVELLTGTLAGKTGSFALQHSSTMHGTDYNMSILVSPGSGTGDLQGISGTFKISIKDGQHFYDLDYTLPEAK